MQRPTLASACVLAAALTLAGLSLKAQSSGDQSSYGSSSSYGASPGSSGSSSGSYGGSSRGSSRGSTSSYGSRSTSSYGSSARSGSSYGGSSRASTASRGTTSSSNSSYGTSSSGYRSSGSYRSSSRNSYGSYGYGRTYGTSSYGARRSARTSSYGQDSRSRRGGAESGGTGYRQIPAPTYVRGRVLSPDGQPLADSLLRVNCGGASYIVGYTGRRGTYNIAVNRCYSLLGMAGARLNRVPDSFNAPFINTAMSGCWLEAISPRRGMARLELGLLRNDIRNNLGSLVLEPVPGQSEHTVSIDTLMAPPEARKAYSAGLREMQRPLPRYTKAAKHFMRAIEIHPKFAPAWVGLGEAYVLMGETEEAEKAFAKAIEADPKYLAPYESMIQMAMDASDWKQVHSLSEKYLALSPAASRVRFYQAVASYNLNDLSAAEATIMQMRGLGEMALWPATYFMMGSMHASRGEFEEGAKQYEAYLASPSGKSDELESKVKRAIHDWSKLQVIGQRTAASTDKPDQGAAPTLHSSVSTPL